MKKRSKRESFGEPRQARPNVAQLIMKMQQQLASLERKIDAMTGHARPQERHFDPRQHNRNEGRRPMDHMERALYKVICADCNRECNVPFKPSQDRPVYCKDCFASRKASSSFSAGADNRPREEGTFQASRPDKKQYGESKRPFKKKSSFSRPRKKRE